MTKSDIFNKIYNALQAWRKEYGQERAPEFICVPREIEEAIRLLPASELGELAAAIFLNGTRASISTLSGFAVKWDAEFLHFLPAVSPKQHVDPTDRNKAGGWKSSKI